MIFLGVGSRNLILADTDPRVAVLVEVGVGVVWKAGSKVAVPRCLILMNPGISAVSVLTCSEDDDDVGWWRVNPKGKGIFRVKVAL
jgi:hypothetical protein